MLCILGCEIAAFFILKGGCQTKLSGLEKGLNYRYWDSVWVLKGTVQPKLRGAEIGVNR